MQSITIKAFMYYTKGGERERETIFYYFLLICRVTPLRVFLLICCVTPLF